MEERLPDCNHFIEPVQTPYTLRENVFMAVQVHMLLRLMRIGATLGVIILA